LTNIDYKFYTEKFGGDLISADLFPAYVTRAVIYLNSITFNQAERCEDINISFAVCDIAEQLYKERLSGGIKHESADGYSVTRDTSSSLKQRLFDTAQTYLACSGLLYRGGVYYEYI